MSDDAFFIPEGDGWYRSTDHTRGPWDPEFQHAGPAAALLGEALAAAAGGQDRRVARVTTEILAPIPVTRVRVEVDVERPGRRVDLVRARLTDVDGQELVLARAWRVRSAEVPVSERVAPDGPPPSREHSVAGAGISSVPWEVGYHTAMELVVVRGGAFDELGPAAGWFRARHPLVAGEPMHPLSRVLIAADSGNGLSASLPLDRYLFINPELTVHLIRYPRGEWVALDARTVAAPDGVGLATSVISDDDGVIGQGAQSLLIDAR